MDKVLEAEFSSCNSSAIYAYVNPKRAMNTYQDRVDEPWNE